MSAPRTAWIGLGANLGDPPGQLRAALQSLAALPGTTVVACSRFFRTAPLGPEDQPDFCNAVACLRTGLASEALMRAMLTIERDLGRIRGSDRWGPRRLDLDLLHVEGEVSETPTLLLPHPEAGRRAFVLVPWAELAPTLEVPGVGAVAALAATLAPAGLPVWDD
jgi:2-amino-4-hydroxy-6-hydroxymethyldihydropteridine diphosphokinase